MMGLMYVPAFLFPLMLPAVVIFHQQGEIKTPSTNEPLTPTPSVPFSA